MVNNDATAEEAGREYEPVQGGQLHRKPGCWRAYSYAELVGRDKANLDIFWLRDDLLEDSANLPEPDVIAEEIVEDLEAVLEQFRLIAEDLGEPEA